MANLIRKKDLEKDINEKKLFFVKGHLLLKRVNNKFRFKVKEKNSDRSSE